MATPEEMDRAAKDSQARPELEENWQKWSAYALALWWHRWVMQVGHVRLFRMVTEVTGVCDEGNLVDSEVGSVEGSGLLIYIISLAPITHPVTHKQGQVQHK